MQHSCSYRSPAPNREHTHTYTCQPLTTVREPFSSHFPCPQRVRSMTSVTFTRKLRKLESGRNLRPCFGKSFSCWCCCLMASRNPVATCRWQERGCLFQVRARMIRALNNWCHAGSKKTCAGSMSCQSCQLMWLSCSNPVLIDHQHLTESTRTHTGVSHWPLWENPSLRTFHARKGSDQWRVSRSQESWESLSLAETSDLVLGRVLVADAAVWRLPGILSLSGILLPVSVPGKNEQSIEQLLPCKKSSTCHGSIAAIQFISITSTEEREHMQASASEHSGRTMLFPVSILAEDQINEFKAEKAWVWQTPCWGEPYLLMLPCDGFQVSRIYQQARCLFRFRVRMSRALNKCCHAGRI